LKARGLPYEDTVPAADSNPATGSVRTDDDNARYVASVFSQHGLPAIGELYSIAILFFRRLRSGDLKAIYWCRLFESQTENVEIRPVVGVSLPKNPMHVIFSLIKLIKGENRNLINPFEEVYMKAGKNDLSRSKPIIYVILSCIYGISVPGLPGTIDMNRVSQFNAATEISDLKSGKYQFALNLSDVTVDYAPGASNFNLKTQNSDPDTTIVEFDQAYSTLTPHSVTVRGTGGKAGAKTTKAKKGYTISFR